MTVISSISFRCSRRSQSCSEKILVTNPARLFEFGP